MMGSAKTLVETKGWKESTGLDEPDPFGLTPLVAHSERRHSDPVRLIDEEDIDVLRRRLHTASAVVQERADARDREIRFAQKLQRKKDLLDLLVVGGVTVAEILRSPNAAPTEIQQAFAMAYPGLASAGETFADAAKRMSSDELVGLVSGVKGKLF